MGKYNLDPRKVYAFCGLWQIGNFFNLQRREGRTFPVLLRVASQLKTETIFMGVSKKRPDCYLIIPQLLNQM